MFNTGNKTNKKDEIFLLRLFQSNSATPPAKKKKEANCIYSVQLLLAVFLKIS